MTKDRTDHLHLGPVATTHPVLHSTGMQMGLILSAILIVWASITFHLGRERDALVDGATRHSQNLAFAAEQGIAGMIAGVDQTLQFARLVRAADPTAFRPEQWVGKSVATAAELELGVVDRNGLRRDAGGGPAIDVSDRAYFFKHKTAPNDALYISVPLQRRRDGAWAIEFSRKLTAADSAFDGVLSASVNPAKLTQLYGTLAIGSGTLVVVGDDGVVRARGSANNTGVGRYIGESELMRQVQGADHGTIRSVSVVDGRDRFLSYQRLQGYPLVVAVGLDAEEVLAPYYRDRRDYLLIGAALTVLILGVGGLLLFQNRRLVRSRQVLSDAVENIDQGLVMIDRHRRIPLMNSRAVELLGLPPHLLHNLPRHDDLVRWQRLQKEFGPVPEGGLDAPPDLTDGVRERTRPSGQVLEIRTRLLDHGGAVRTFTDITERRQAEERVRYVAHHDDLTGLPNRTLLIERIAEAIPRAAATEGLLAIHALDLDRFKPVNDGYGHAVGDELLVEVGVRLRGLMQEGDTLARIGGDEFVVLQAGLRDPVEASAMARRLVDAFTEPFELGGHPVRIGTSVGVAVFPSHGTTPPALLKAADTALYAAKAEGRGTFCVFKARMELRLREQKIMRDDLRAAIGTDQLRVHYQPIVTSDTREILGFEALLRWQHPVLGNIPPMAFIPTAEESGMILAIGGWVLEHACAAAAAWPQPKRIAINLSAAQLRSGTLPEQVAGVLRRTGLTPNLLELEVTETLLIEKPAAALATLRELQAMGVRIACDDFGTGYSSFLYLQNLAFDRIKIDKSFVQALTVSQSSARIVQAIFAMAQSLHLDVTAEGVETEQQLMILRDQRCQEVQGYLFGRPMPEEEVAPLLMKPPARPALARS